MLHKFRSEATEGAQGDAPPLIEVIRGYERSQACGLASFVASTGIEPVFKV